MRRITESWSIVLILLFVTATLALLVGHTLGRNRRIESDLIVSIPMYLSIYKDIRSGETNRAASYATMSLMSKVDRYDVSSRSIIFRITSSGKVANSSWLRSKVEEARKVIAQEKTNLISITTRPVPDSSSNAPRSWIDILNKPESK